MNGRPIAASALHAEAIATVHALAFPPGERWDAAIFASHLALPGVFGFLHPYCGMVLARVAADEAEILTIAVIPAARHAGVGRALLRAAEDHAASAGARTMFLEVSPANLVARALYSSAGFAEVGRRRSYYPDGSDALLLARTLTPAAAIDG